jgi:hypothetical protein
MKSVGEEEIGHVMCERYHGDKEEDRRKRKWK